MNYDDQVLKNMSAIPADKSLQNKEDLMIQQSVYGSLNNWRIKSEEDRKCRLEKIRIQRWQAKMVQWSSRRTEADPGKRKH